MVTSNIAEQYKMGYFDIGIERKKVAHHVFKNWFYDFAIILTFEATLLAHVVQHELLACRFAASNLRRWLCQKPILETIWVYV